jgi:hypothetical protein
MMNTFKLIRLLTSLRFSLIRILFIIVAMLTGQQLFSQQLSDTVGKPGKKDFKEVLCIRTDRDIYITGEQVWVKIYEISGLTQSPCNISKVVYLELLDKNNFPLKQLKIKTDNSSGSSVFVLPDNLSSGNYLIRAYTSWMQNFSADHFSYSTISVINPFESIDHLKLPEAVVKTDSVGSVTTSSEQSSALNGLQARSNSQINYILTLEKQQFSPRGNVRLTISASDKTGNPVESDLSVSVARSALIKPSSVASFIKLNGNNKAFERTEPKEYLAELEGHLISGHIRQKTTDEPIKNIDISLSFVGKIARCLFTKTDENGEFIFLVKETGLNEIVIQPLSLDINGYYIELYQPFSNSFSNIKTAEFYIDSSKISEINKAIVGAQVTSIYEPFVEKPEETNSVGPDFFGKPESSVKMSDYIELTSTREVVKEIIPNVYTQKQNGKYDFKLINKFRGQPFENKPLVLVDGIPVYDFEKVLNINSKEIERADVINTRYFYSGNVFDGILSFITKKGNLSAMEFDNSIFRQVYQGCQVQKDFYSPVYNSEVKKNARLADFRNTLLWKPDIRTGKDGKAEIDFYTSDESAEYTIIVEGMSADGKTGYSESKFLVK